MRSKTTPIIIAIMIPLISVAVALALVYFKKSASDGVSAFPYSDYMASPKNLSGNVYSLKAELEMQLSRIPSKGRVVSVRDEKRHKFAVLIPDGLDVNAQTKQRYDMDVKVGSDGEIIVCSMRKY